METSGVLGAAVIAGTVPEIVHVVVNSVQGTIL